MVVTRKFPRSLWGYKPSAVQEYVALMNAEAERKVNQIQSEAERVKKANSDLMARVKAVEDEIAKYQEEERAVAKAIVAAQVEASAMEEQARKAADEHKRRVLAEIAVKRVELNNLRKELERFRSALGEMLETVEATLEAPSAVDPNEVAAFLRGESGEIAEV